MTEPTPEHVPQPQSHDEPPPRGVRGMAFVRWLIIVLAAVIAVGAWWVYASGDRSASSGARYQCPMHPQVVSDVPGECPICHMTLEPIATERLGKQLAGSAVPAAQTAPPAGELAHDHAHEAAKGPTYTCPMHPEIRSAEPGRCPKCKMPLELVEPEQTAAAPGADAGTAAPVVPVTLGLDRVQTIGVRTSVVEAAAPGGALRVTASVEAPERQTGQVHVRAPGFVERISVKDTGVRVKAGQELIAVYSPELFQAQNELLLARRWQQSDAGGPSSALEQSERKLELLGMSRAEIEQVLASGEVRRAVRVLAPVSGTVVRKNVVLGSYVTPDVALYEIVDLSSIYVLAEVFQSDVPLVPVGTRGRFVIPARNFSAEATVDLIYPTVSSEGRTTRVRMIIKNPGLELLPGEYGHVEFARSPSAAETVFIPRDALIDTGLHRYVFVDLGQGRFEPRPVTVAEERPDKIAIRAGLHAGERVVSGATFLIDSESRLQASLIQQSAAAASAAPSQPGQAP